MEGVSISTAIFFSCAAAAVAAAVAAVAAAAVAAAAVAVAALFSPLSSLLSGTPHCHHSHCWKPLERGGESKGGGNVKGGGKGLQTRVFERKKKKIAAGSPTQNVSKEVFLNKKFKKN